MEFHIGQKVKLTELSRKMCVEPEKYEHGIITRVGTYGVYDVTWNGFDHPISMLHTEMEGDLNAEN